jgi:hypothetical protein
MNLELDAELVKPSYVVSLGGLEKRIQKIMKENPAVSYHKNNYQFLLTLKNKIKKGMEELVLMKEEGINDLKKYLSKGKLLKVCILNGSVILLCCL